MRSESRQLLVSDLIKFRVRQRFIASKPPDPSPKPKPVVEASALERRPSPRLESAITKFL
jgi:hypothetical protein